jgi:flavin reductase (DIM6/NTAB) family NADH-FMN oxidoreductase RutF
MKLSLGAKTIAWPLPVWVIGSYGADGQPNAMTASWAGVCCSQPPCVYFSARRSRHTYACVSARQAFTVNIPSAAQVAVADYLGIASGRETMKLAVAGLDVERAEFVDAPVIIAFPLILECQVRQVVDLGSHAMFIGEVLDVKCEAAQIGADGKPDLALLSSVSYCTANSKYYAVEKALGSAYSLGLGIADRKLAE